MLGFKWEAYTLVHRPHVPIPVIAQLMNRSEKNTRPKLKSQVIGLLDFTGVVEKSCGFSFFNFCHIVSPSHTEI